MQADHLNFHETSSSFQDGKERAVIVSLSVAGYYSIPVRLLSLIVQENEEVSSRWDVKYAEWDKHSETQRCCEELLSAKPSLVAFSVNIWNLQAVEAMSAAIKAINPHVRILCGGQEVTHSFIDYLHINPAWDYIIDGEGEIAFVQFLENWDPLTGDLAAMERVSGLRYRGKDGLSKFTCPAEVITDLDESPSIILADMVPALRRNRLGVMLEGSRGCNCKCTFCFEGYCDRAVKRRCLDQLEKEIEFMIRKGSRLFHLLDPIIAGHDTCRTQRIMEIFDKHYQHHRDLRVSVEGYAEQMNPADCEALGRPFVTVDLGLQSLNPQTLKSIRRPFRKDRFMQSFEELQQTPARINIYLICGLPYETSFSYLTSINMVVRMNPDIFFLNELVILNGTELKAQVDENDWEYEYNPRPPYEVAGNRWIPAKELSAVNSAAKAVNCWYSNSRRPVMSMHSWSSTKPLNAQKSTSVTIRQGRLYVGLPGAPSDSPLMQDDDGVIRDSKVMLHVNDADQQAIEHAMVRLQLLECVRITGCVPQSGLNRNIVASGFRLLRVFVEQPQQLAEDLRAFQGFIRQANKTNTFGIELIWPEGEPLPSSPEFYEMLDLPPICIVISTAASIDEKEIIPSLTAAVAAGIWVRMNSDTDWISAAVLAIWSQADEELIEELVSLDKIFDPLTVESSGDAYWLNSSEVGNFNVHKRT